MKLLLLLPFLVSIDDRELIEEFHSIVQSRLENPPQGIGHSTPFGMSRAVSPSSVGDHFRPNPTSRRDFIPEDDRERRFLASSERLGIELGFYTFGEAVTYEPPQAYAFRALKGPAAITASTPRFELPSWQAMYPVALRAMKSFQDGGKGFDTTVGNWQVAVRPAIASEQKCIACHYNSGAPPKIKAGQSIGGFLYAYRPRPVAGP